MTQLSKNFTRAEFASKCGRPGYDTVDAELLAIIQDVRNHFNKPVHIASGHRSPEHNLAVGGTRNSFHLSGRAADLVVRGVVPDDVASYLEQKYPGRLGIGRYLSFTHVDTRSGYSSRFRL